MLFFSSPKPGQAPSAHPLSWPHNVMARCQCFGDHTALEKLETGPQASWAAHPPEGTAVNPATSTTPLVHCYPQHWYHTGALSPAALSHWCSVNTSSNITLVHFCKQHYHAGALPPAGLVRGWDWGGKIRLLEAEATIAVLAGVSITVTISVM